MSGSSWTLACCRSGRISVMSHVSETQGWQLRTSRRRPSSCCPRALSRLCRNERGASALEFAIVAPLLFAVFFMAIEITVVLFADSVLENASNRITRIGKLGVPDGQDCDSTVRAAFEDALSSWAVSPLDMRLDVQVYRAGQGIRFGDVDDEDYSPICDAGERGEIVMYRLMLDRAGLTGILGWMDSDFVRLERIVAIQNEP